MIGVTVNADSILKVSIKNQLIEISSGTGFLFGIGMDDDIKGTRFGYTYYNNLGGISDADAGFLYYGFRF